MVNRIAERNIDIRISIAVKRALMDIKNNRLGNKTYLSNAGYQIALNRGLITYSFKGVELVVLSPMSSEIMLTPDVNKAKVAVVRRLRTILTAIGLETGFKVDWDMHPVCIIYRNSTMAKYSEVPLNIPFSIA